MIATKILACPYCKHPGQDSLHGQELRLHNLTRQQKPEAERTWRCTVCKNEKSV